MSPFKCLFLTAALSLSSAAIADDSGLYDAPAPEDAVFVRAIGAPITDVSALGYTFAELTEDYTAISASLLDGVAAGSYYALLPIGDAPTLVAEPLRDDPAKVHLTLLNVDAPPLQLTVLDGPQVIGATEQATAQSRAVNPVTITLKVESADGSQQFGTFDVALRRGQNLTFVVQNGEARILPDLFGPVVAGR